MKIPSTANADARSYVLKCKEFNGAKNGHSRNGYAVSGRKVGHLYVVYSYGYWPMFVCDPRTDTWFVNAHRYSNTTSKQSSQCYPTGKDCAPVPTAELEEMLSMAGSANNPY
jgi:hypothetical protein